MRRGDEWSGELMKRFQPDPSRYEIERNRGEGLSATVCKAIRIDSRENVRQVVALKFPKDGTRIADLRHEFEALSRVSSKHCARALAWESAGSQNVLVLEWIDGPTLFELASSRQIPAHLCEEIVVQTYQGLLDLKDKGLHHGDLHPGNIMIGLDGVVRLIDFASRGKKARNEMHYGVPAFLAPETRSSLHKTSFEADLFALGVIRRGLEHGFRQLPQIAMVEKVGLCAFEPSLRHLEIDLSSSFERQALLKDLVSEFLHEKRVSKTQILGGSRDQNLNALISARDAFSALHMLGLVLFSALSISVRAEAPLVQPVSNAKLAVSTIQWANVRLNGKEVGYSPVEIESLTPGTHRLSWSSAFGAGSLVLELKSGELKRIDERALRAHSKP